MTAGRLAGKHVFVTGATGFIGRHLVPVFRSEGAQLSLWRHQRAIPATEAHCQIVEGTPADESFRRAVLECDAVCHLAAFIPPSHEDPAFAPQCLEVNALLSLELARIASRKPSLRFIHFSTGQSYQPCGDRSAREDDPVYPSGRAPYYLGSKLLGEIFVEALRLRAGLCALSFRIGSCYGPGMPQTSVLSRFIERATRGEALAVHHGGVPAADFVHVTDLVSIAAAALTSGEAGIYNLGSGTAVSLLELARAVAQEFAPGRSPKIELRPPSGPVPPSFAALSMEKTCATWGIRPRSLRQGLADLRSCLTREVC